MACKLGLKITITNLMTVLTGFTCKTGTVNFSSKSQRSKSPYYANFKQKGTKLKNEKTKFNLVKKFLAIFDQKI